MSGELSKCAAILRSRLGLALRSPELLSVDPAVFNDTDEKLLELVDQTQVTQEFKENYLQLDSLEKIERLVNFNEDKLNGTQYLLLLRSLIATWHDLISVRPDEHGYSEARDQIKLFNSKI